MVSYASVTMVFSGMSPWTAVFASCPSATRLIIAGAHARDSAVRTARKRELAFSCRFLLHFISKCFNPACFQRRQRCLCVISARAEGRIEKSSAAYCCSDYIKNTCLHTTETARNEPHGLQAPASVFFPGNGSALMRPQMVIPQSFFTSIRLTGSGITMCFPSYPVSSKRLIHVWISSG